METPLLPRLCDHCEIDGPHGRHLCLVLPVLSESVSTFRRLAPSKLLDTPKVKIIVAQVVEALVKLHAANIVRTDLKPDNVLFNEGNAPQTIKALLDQSPQVTDGEFELKGARYPIMRSQPIPHPFKWDDPGIMVELYSVCLTDFAQFLDREPATRTISAFALRAPEVILGATYDVKVDIWALGCMAKLGVSNDHLAKMAELTGENFSDKILTKSRKRDEYFDENGKLLCIDQLFPMSLKSAMINYGLPEPEATSAAAFINVCLRLDPEERPSAGDILDHPWCW
ncbi:kinase-like protein [Rhizopogon salebrosus TDB-379]|nr:kinase-like protein [Rhizopogon salebrosus TDB-379]